MLHIYIYIYIYICLIITPAVSVTKQKILSYKTYVTTPVLKTGQTEGKQKLLSGATENNGFQIDGGASLLVAAKLCTIPALT